MARNVVVARGQFPEQEDRQEPIGKGPTGLWPSATLRVTKTPLSEAGLRLEAELDRLVNERLPAVGEWMRGVREGCADSGDYGQAMEELAALQARIVVLRLTIGSGEIFRPQNATANEVHLGSTVTL